MHVKLGQEMFSYFESVCFLNKNSGPVNIWSDKLCDFVNFPQTSSPALCSAAAVHRASPVDVFAHSMLMIFN